MAFKFTTVSLMKLLLKLMCKSGFGIFECFISNETFSKNFKEESYVPELGPRNVPEFKNGRYRFTWLYDPTHSVNLNHSF